MLSIGTPESEGKATKLWRISRGVQSVAVRVVFATMLRNERRTLFAFRTVSHR